MTRTADFQYGEWVLSNMEVGIQSGDEWMVKCPKHEDNRPSLQINVEKGLFTCFSCDWHGHIKRIGNYLGVNVAAGEISDSRLADLISGITDDPNLRIPIKPESYLHRFIRAGADYWAERGFSDDTIKTFELGYDMLANAATIPLRGTNGELYGVNRRFLDKDSKVKYRYAKQFIRKENIFGSWLVKQDNDPFIVLSEGCADTMAVHQAGYNAGAIYGNRLSTAQVRLLHELGIETVVLMMDNDDKGRECVYGKYDADDPKSYKPGAAQLLHEFTVLIVRYRYSRHKDPADMARRPGLIQAEVEAARPFRL